MYDLSLDMLKQLVLSLYSVSLLCLFTWCCLCTLSVYLVLSLLFDQDALFSDMFREKERILFGPVKQITREGNPGDSDMRQITPNEVTMVRGGEAWRAIEGRDVMNRAIEGRDVMNSYGESDPEDI